MRTPPPFIFARAVLQVGCLCVLVSLQVACHGTSEAGRVETLTVFAASSLTEAFRDLAEVFEAQNPGATVRLAFSGSQVLRLQIEHGAEADVFASADQRHIDALAKQALLSSRTEFAQNQLALVVPIGNPAAIESFTDLRDAKRIVVGAPTVPVGQYTRELLTRARSELGTDFEVDVIDRIVSEEINVRLVRAKVELGEADAAILYRTDAALSNRIEVVPIPPDFNVVAQYHIGVLERSSHPRLAERWVTLLRSEDGRRVLSERGFVVE